MNEKKLSYDELEKMLGNVIRLEMKSVSEELFIGYFKVNAIRKNHNGDIFLHGVDEEGMNRSIPVSWIAAFEIEEIAKSRRQYGSKGNHFQK